MQIKLDQIRPSENKNSLSEFLNKDIQLGPQFNLKKKQALYNDLFLLFSAGLDMKRALELIVEEQKNKKDKTVLSKVYNEVIAGVSLSEALNQEKDFTDYEIYSLKIGEESGKLVEVLEHLKNYYHKRIEQKRQVSSALSYPIVVLCIAIAAVTFMIGFVVPAFAKTFSTFNAELPPITQWLIDVSDNFYFYISSTLTCVLLLLILLKIFKDKPVVKKWKAKVILSIPFIGKIVHLSKLTQFCENMRLLVSAKTSLLESINLTSQMINFYPLQEGLIRAKKDVMNGESLNQSLKKSKIFPSRMVYLLAVGEEVNKLEEIFLQLSELYGNELQHKSKLLGSVLEPILLIFIACLVGFIVIALYMPMFSLSELI